MISLMQERPPYVTFEIRTEEDREATIREGRYMAKDVDFAIIVPAGSKDCIERKATEWLSDIKRKSEYRPPGFNPLHADHFHKMYRAWKDKQEMPLSGTPINGWPAISPAQQDNLLSVNVRTVEDLAFLNESGLQRIGMGARALQDKAKAWIDSANDHGKVSSQVSALKLKVEEQDKKIQELITANEELMSNSAKDEPRTKRPYKRKKQRDEDEQ